MTRRNKILLSVLLAAVLALLIALCFVGNTFARYTLKQDETVSASIAEWGVTVDDSSVTDHKVTVSDLRPSSDKYTEDGSVQRTKVAQFTQVAVLTNTGDVSATVSISSGTVASGATYQEITDAKAKEYGVTGNTGDTYEPGNDTNYAGDSVTTGADYAEKIGDHIIADVYYSTNSAITSADDSNLNPLNGSDITLVPDGQTGDSTIYIYLDVEWISDLYDTTSEVYVNGDGFDTWCGAWVESFSFDITIEAFQAS